MEGGGYGLLSQTAAFGQADKCQFQKDSTCVYHLIHFPTIFSFIVCLRV